MLTTRPGRTIALAAATLLILGGGPASGQPAPGERVAKFKAMAADFKAVNDELRKLEPDLKAVRASTKKVSAAAAQLPSWFPKGSGPESGVPTRAKPELWTNAELFTTNARNFRTEAEKLQKLAAGDDIDAMKLQTKAVGAECAACHTDFRAAQ